MGSAPSPLQRCFPRSWGSCLLPCSAACTKPLTSGYLPLSAVLLPGYMVEVLHEHSARHGGVFGHGYTYTSHPVPCALALKVLEITEVS